jgi:hypothetical protein
LAQAAIRSSGEIDLFEKKCIFPSLIGKEYFNILGAKFCMISEEFKKNLKTIEKHNLFNFNQ